ncbi:hypothetical protein EMIT0324P_10884 [Pseudomonas chlororaphis]
MLSRWPVRAADSRLSLLQPLSIYSPQNLLYASGLFPGISRGRVVAAAVGCDKPEGLQRS